MMVTELKELIEQIISMHFPVGMIMCYPSCETPEGWLPCDGSQYKISDYPSLAGVLSVTTDCKGDSEGYFRVPDLQGKFVRGLDLDGMVDPEREIGSFQEDTFQGHEHTINSIMTKSDGYHKHELRIDQFDSKHYYGDATVLSAYTDQHYWGEVENPFCFGGSHFHTIPEHQSNGILTSKYE